MDKLLLTLSQKGIQPSFQRLKVLDALLSEHNHPNAAMLYEKLAAEMPTISKTTIYNTLNAFAEKGLVSVLTIRPDEVRYDGETTPHHHLLCRKCGAIIDVHVHCGVAESLEIDGHSVDEVHGYFKGVCRDCRSDIGRERHMTKKKRRLAMADRFQVFKCDVCGNIVEVLEGGKGQLVCCNQPMRAFVENTVDAAKEKHVPVIESVPEGTKVKVGSVTHPMEEKHYIQWIELIIDGSVCRKFLTPGAAPEAVFPVKAENAVAREYCNLHGLWKA
jgi:superoxide reductase